MIFRPKVRQIVTRCINSIRFCRILGQREDGACPLRNMNLARRPTDTVHVHYYLSNSSSNCHQQPRSATRHKSQQGPAARHMPPDRFFFQVFVGHLHSTRKIHCPNRAPDQRNCILPVSLQRERGHLCAGSKHLLPRILVARVLHGPAVNQKSQAHTAPFNCQL